ncbi:MAG: hypothetical protein Q4A22_05990 [Kocuria sp.]|nr:hypothetical protein [Kocuria sp.]
MAWAAPTIVLSAPAPAAAASIQDVVVGTTSCSDGSGNLNNIPFTVSTVNGAVIPAGTVFTVNYAGGSTTPTWSGTLATNSTAAITPGNNTSTNGGRYGSITFTLKNPMPASTTWTLNLSMDIGALITGQRTTLSLTSSIPDQNHNTSNDTATHEMYFGGCRD